MHILIADDYPDAAEMLAEIVTEFAAVAISLETAYDGRQALAAAWLRRPDVALLDIDMPVMTGIEAALGIRALSSPLPLLIAITGNAGHQRSPRTREAFDHILIKPFEIDELIALLWPPEKALMQGR